MAALFSGHPYARPVWGDPGVIEKVQPQVLETWYRRYFIPNNMAVAITGGLDAAGILDQVRLHFTDLSAGPTVDRSLPPLPPLGKGTEAVVTMDITEHHFFMGFRAPAQAEAHRLPFDMLAQIFGRGINPLLRQALRAANPDLVDAFNLQYIPLDRAGLLFIHIRSGADKSSRLRREIGRFFVATARMPFALEDMHPQVRHGAVDHMANAVTHLRMLYHSFQENGLSLASAYARSLMMQKEAQDEPYLTRLAKLKSKDLNRAIDTHLAGKNHVSVHIGPLEKK
jgi:predicted Zn-dependent peptidase